MSRLALVLILAGCTAPADESRPPLVPVPHGKADNYFSNVSAEIEVNGTLHVALPEGADPQQQIARRLTAFGLYLTAYVTDKFRGIDVNGDGTISDDEVFFHNDKYGNFKAMVRNQTVAPGDITDVEGGLEVKFKLDVAGPNDLLARLGREFDVKEPKDAVLDPANVDYHAIRDFDPATYTGELETVRCTAKPLPMPGNAYPQLDAFASDGVIDVTLFQGYDYNASRADLYESELLYLNLVAWGFTSPVASYAELTADSGPLVMTMTAGGKPVRLEVRIFHADMFKADRKRQHDLALSELTTRDIFFYNGHAGPYYGFYLDAANQATVHQEEFAKAPFTSKQQLFVAQGCQTYSQYADMLYANPQKDESNLDVITTINFSYGLGTETLLWNLLGMVNVGNEMYPRDYLSLVSDLNADATNSQNQVLYGAIGVDGNPQLYPFTDASVIGKSCATETDCGAGWGYICGAFTQKRCGVLTLAPKACPEGSTYYDLAAGDTIQLGACF
jgi:hypothetical protein